MRQIVVEMLAGKAITRDVPLVTPRSRTSTPRARSKYPATRNARPQVQDAACAAVIAGTVELNAMRMYLDRLKPQIRVKVPSYAEREAAGAGRR